MILRLLKLKNGLILSRGIKFSNLTPEEYEGLRKKRNKLRDEYNQTASFLFASQLKKEIKEIDKELSNYEKQNKSSN